MRLGTVDYPRNLREFDRLFAHKDACLHFLEKVRWGAGFACQSCGSKDYWVLGSGLRRCKSCRFKNSVKTGTIFESSRLPLKMWFYAIWWITAQKTGVSALDLQKDIGLGSYRSAWLLLHKIRNAMVQADRSLLQGDIEVDLVELGAGEKHLVAVAAEFSGLKRIGRVRLERIRDVSSWNLEQFLSSNVVRGSTIYLSGARGSGELSRLGFKQQTRKAARGTREQALPRVNSIAELLGRWLKGTLHGRLEAKHMSSYLEEFEFRFNRRTAKARGILFQRVIENAVLVKPAPYSEIVARKG